MIPYDDLVAALATWRARQGLAVVTASTAARVTAPPRASTAVRSVPPAPPRPASPPPPIDAGDDFDDGALIEDSPYDPSGEDYVVPLGEVGVETNDPTAIGAPDGLLTPKRGKRTDW